MNEAMLQTTVLWYKCRYDIFSRNKRNFFRNLRSTQQGTSLFVRDGQSTPGASSLPDADGSFHDPNEGQEGERKGRPVDELGGALVIKDCPQGPSNSNASREITLGRGERVCCGSSLQEEQGQEDKDLGPDTCGVHGGIDTKGLKGGQEDEDSSPSMPQRERQMDEQLVCNGLGGVMLLDNVVDVGDRGADEQREYKCDNVVVRGPQVDVDRVEDGEEGKAPGDSVDDDGLGVRGGELVDDGAEQQEMDDGPDDKGPVGRGQVGLLDRGVDGTRRGDRVQVRPEEQKVHEHIHNLEEDAVFPLGGHGN